MKGEVEVKMQNFIRERNRLKDNNQQITYEGEVIATVFKEIDYILCSLHDIGSYYVDKEKEEYEKETTKFIDDSFVCNRLAAIRTILLEPFDLSLGKDEMDDVERICEDTPYWSKPGDSCKEIWTEAFKKNNVQ